MRRSLRAPAAKRTKEKQQDDRTEYGADDAGEVEAGDACMTEDVVHPASDEGADYPDDDIAENTARPLTGNDPLGDDPDDQSENKPRENAHVLCQLLLCRLTSPRGRFLKL